MRQFISPWTGEVFESHIGMDAYANNGRMVLNLIILDNETFDGKNYKFYEPYCDITVNLPGEILSGENCAFVDVNNAPFITPFLEENGLAEPTGMMGFSGWCAYPEYRFNMDAVREHLFKGES